MSNRSSLEKEQQKQEQPNVLILEESINTATTTSEKSPATSTSTEPSLLDIDDEFSSSNKPEPNADAVPTLPIEQESNEQPQDEISNEDIAPVEEKHDGFDDFDTAEQPNQEAEANDDFDDFNTLQEQQQTEADDDFDEFGEFDDDGFVDANGDDDDFGDFDDFEAAPPPLAEFEQQQQREVEEPEEEIPKTPTEAELYVDVLENRPKEMKQFIENYLTKMWGAVGHTEEGEEEEVERVVSSPLEQNEVTTDILNTPCSRDLWSKLSRDTVFYNPVTGAVGQFQWTRSETNKAYLNALGVTFNSEEKSPAGVHSPTSTSPNHIHTSPTSAKQQRRQSNIVDGKRLGASNNTSSSTTSLPETSSTHLRSASATGGLRVVTSKMDESAKEAKKEADQEMELDIDIARAYCELTEETIRIFPDVKLNAMVIELSRLQRQAADYLDNLLDQREQLKMDAETYNDLISCIVGHAQRLHVQSKDASPAMVSKKKKSSNSTGGGGGGFLRRKNITTNVSMGGGVVGVKQQQPSSAGGPPPKRTTSTASQIPTTSESRRSM